MKRKAVILGIVLLAVAVAGVILVRAGAGVFGKPLRFELIASGQCRGSGLKGSGKETRAIVRNDREWKEWWNRYAGESNPPEVDFTQKMLICLTYVCTDTSVNFEVDRVVQTFDKALKIRVVYSRRGEYGMEVIFNNYQVYSVERVEAPVVWIIEDLTGLN